MTSTIAALPLNFAPPSNRPLSSGSPFDGQVATAVAREREIVSADANAFEGLPGVVLRAM